MGQNSSKQHLLHEDTLHSNYKYWCFYNDYKNVCSFVWEPTDAQKQAIPVTYKYKRRHGDTPSNNEGCDLSFRVTLGTALSACLLTSVMSTAKVTYHW